MSGHTDSANPSNPDNPDNPADSVMLAQERERLRMAGQLHDEVGSHLLALRLALARLRNRMTAPDPTQDRAWLAQQLTGLEQQAQAAQDAVRRISHGLWPPVLALGLHAALQSLADSMSSTLPCTFAASGPEPVLADEIGLNLFLICQEALQNIAKHAAASAASVQLACDGAGLELKISDNGDGMPEPSRTGFGVRQMHTRARAIGARLALLPNRPAGTLWHLYLPLPALPAAPTNAEHDHD